MIWEQKPQVFNFPEEMKFAVLDCKMSSLFTETEKNKLASSIIIKRNSVLLVKFKNKKQFLK